jgi:hypothetical protein
MGFKGPVQSRIVQAMIEFNRDDKTRLVRPDIITDNRAEWQLTGRLEFYLDVETIGNVFDDFHALPRRGSQNMIFMVGVGWVDPSDGSWHYRPFVAADLTKQSEARMLDSALLYIAEVIDSQKIDYTPVAYHWSRAEPVQFEKALSEHMDLTVYTDFTFVDMLSVFKDETVLIKGVYDFGLKSVSRGMARHGLIPDLYTTAITGGNDAMLRAHTCYRTAASRGVPVTTLVQFRHIITYNEVDCKIIWEIVKYLRSNHSAVSM